MRKFKLSLKITGCDLVFHPEFEPGVIGTQELAFPTATKKSDKDVMFLNAKMEYEEEFMKKFVEVIWEEIK